MWNGTFFFKILDGILVACIAAMLVMVFGNVVLRAVFNSGIDVSEELPRFLFVWMTFIGAVIGFREGAHFGVDALVRLLPRAGKKVCWAINQVVILVCCAVIVQSTLLQHDLNATNHAPVTGLSMIWVFGVTYLTGGAIGLMCILNLVRLALGKVGDDELIQVEEEGMGEVNPNRLKGPGTLPGTLTSPNRLKETAP